MRFILNRKSEFIIYLFKKEIVCGSYILLHKLDNNLNNFKGN